MRHVKFCGKEEIFCQDVFANVNDSHNTRLGHKQRYNLPRSNDGLTNNDGQLPSINGIEATFKNINQTRMINDSFGQLSVNLQDRKKKTGSSLFKNKFHSRPPMMVMGNSLPALGIPGSNMSNVSHLPGSDMLSNLSLEPLGNVEELVIPNLMKRHNDDNYQSMRLMFFLSTIVCLVIILFEGSAMAMGIMYTNRCEMVDIFLIVSAVVHIIVVLLEWAKAWVWIQSTSPIVPDNNADHMQIFVTCFLVLLYCLCIVWYTVGFAWIPNVSSFPIHNQSMPRVIHIKHNNVTYEQFIPECSEHFYIFSVSYQVIIALLFLFRVVMCCMSNFCQVICSKIASHTSSIPNDLYISNPLHEFLPPMREPLFKWGYHEDRQTTGLQALYNSNNFSMIAPIPFYSSEERPIQDIPDLQM